MRAPYALGLLLLVGACTKPSQPPKVPPVATVNGSAITVQQLTQAFVRRQLVADGAGGVGALADQLLLDTTQADLVNRRLMTLAARENHLAVFSAEVDAAWRHLIHAWEPQALASALAQLGTSALGVKEDLHEGLLAQKYVRAMVLDRVAVLDIDIEAYLASHPNMLLQDEQVRLRHIVAHDAAGLKAVRELLRRGKPFADVAIALSKAADAPTGGDLGVLTQKALPPSLAKVIFAMPVRKVSEPITLSDGIHLYWVSEKLPRRSLSIAHARPFAERALRRQREDQALSAHLIALRDKAQITTREVRLEEVQ
jgi:peptidyl-prolyl cis-trans isomerase SurA